MIAVREATELKALADAKAASERELQELRIKHEQEEKARLAAEAETKKKVRL